MLENKNYIFIKIIYYLLIIITFIQSNYLLEFIYDTLNQCSCKMYLNIITNNFLIRFFKIFTKSINSIIWLIFPIFRPLFDAMKRRQIIYDEEENLLCEIFQIKIILNKLLIFFLDKFKVTITFKLIINYRYCRRSCEYVQRFSTIRWRNKVLRCYYY